MNRCVKSEWLGYLIIAASAIGLDQFVKELTVRNLKSIDVYDLWPGVFRLNYEENTGAAFSFLSGHTWLFIVLTVVLCGLIVYALYRGMIRSSVARIALVCVVAGGIGNLIDRVRHGFVVDMFDFYLIDFAVFNVADVFVCCGCALFVLMFVITKGDVLD